MEKRQRPKIQWPTSDFQKQVINAMIHNVIFLVFELSVCTHEYILQIKWQLL